jgi:hypothetical protein
MLLSFDIVIYFEVHTKDTYTLCEQNYGFCSLKFFLNTVTSENLRVNSVYHSVLHEISFVLRREIAEFSDNAKISIYPSKYITGNYFGKLANSDLNICTINVLVLFRPVNVCICTASSEYEKFRTSSIDEYLETTNV